MTHSQSDITNMRSQLTEVKDSSTLALEILSRAASKDDLARIMRTHLITTGNLLDLDKMPNEFLASFSDTYTLITAFLIEYSRTSDIPTIARRMASARHTYLQGYFSALESDINSAEEELQNGVS